jgi:carbon monoxide dehydrogenase subunit G
MSTLTLTKHINAAPEKVFAVSTDLEAFPTTVPTITRIEVLTPGPVGNGTRFRETRIMFGKEATETMEFSEFQPAKGYTIGCTSCGVRYTTRFTLRPIGTGTELAMEIDCSPVSFFAKVLSPITGFMMRGAMKKMLDADLECIKKAAEKA